MKEVTVYHIDEGNDGHHREKDGAYELINAYFIFLHCRGSPYKKGRP